MVPKTVYPMADKSWRDSFLANPLFPKSHSSIPHPIRAKDFRYGRNGPLRFFAAAPMSCLDSLESRHHLSLGGVGDHASSASTDSLVRA